MVTAANLLSWEEFEKLPDDGMRQELIQGELITLPLAEIKHGRIAKRIFRALLKAEDEGLGYAYHEVGYKLSERPASWVQPDVSFLSTRRDYDTRGEKYIHGAPELAVEVISPSESGSDIDQKVELMLAAGAQTVWIVYPRTRHVMVHQSNGTVSKHYEGDVLTADILPGFELPVKNLFEED